MKKILFCTKYERLGASSRLRTFQFLPYLKLNYICQVNSLFSNQYVENIYKKAKQNKLLILFAYIKRFLLLITTDANVVVIEKELFPYVPYCIEWLCLWNKKYIIDIDDAVFHNYDYINNKILRIFLGNKFKGLFKNAYSIWSGSQYILSYATESNLNRVKLMPTVVDLNKYKKLEIVTLERSEYVSIGWIGTTESSIYLNEIIDIFSIISKKMKIKLKLIGTLTKFNVTGVDIENIVWEEDCEVNEISKFDIGIMPLADTTWAKGKCAYKLIQYMACSKAVVASDIGENKKVVQDGINGFLCSTKDEWVIALGKLIIDKSLRLRFGEKGREIVERNYALQTNLPKMEKDFNSMIK